MSQSQHVAIITRLVKILICDLVEVALDRKHPILLQLFPHPLEP